MPIERAELEALFNSSDNEVEDERMKEFEDRSRKANTEMSELEESVSSQNLPSILEEATGPKVEEEIPHDEGTISLDDLTGSEEMNMEEQVDPHAEEQQAEYDCAQFFLNDNVIIDYDDDEEITLDDLMNSENVSEDVEKDAPEPKDDKISLDDLTNSENVSEDVEKAVPGRIPLEIDFDDEEEVVAEMTQEELDEIENRHVMNCEASLGMDSDSEEAQDLREHPLEGVKVKIVEPEPETEVEAEPVVGSRLDKVCDDKKYLNDPRYAEFYRQKLRAYEFLKYNVPKIDYKQLREEMEEFHVSVRMEGVISLDTFNDKIQQVQAVRNRLTKIKSLCIQNYVPRKRVVRLLEDCLMKESQEKSNDKRAGEIQIHMAEMEYDLALSEAFLKDIEQIMDNITSAHEALSRQITVIQERNREIQRGEEPYIDSTQDDKDSILSDDDNEDEEDMDRLGKDDVRTKWKNIM